MIFIDSKWADDFLFFTRHCFFLFDRESVRLSKSLNLQVQPLLIPPLGQKKTHCLQVLVTSYVPGISSRLVVSGLNSYWERCLVGRLVGCFWA